MTTIEEFGQVSEIDSNFRKKEQYFQRDRNRFIEHSKLYWAVDYGQWPNPALQRILEEGRQAPTFPILTQKMDQFRGSLLRNQFDMRAEPIEGDVDDLSLAFQDMYYSDKNLMKWDFSYDVFLRDFLIQYGVESLGVSDKEHPAGNLYFRPENPILIFPDPNWKTMSSDDMMEMDKIAFLTANEMRRLYPDRQSDLDFARLRMTIQAKSYGEQESGIAHQNIESMWGDKQKVIENHRIIEEDRWWEYDITNGLVPLPETGFKNQSKEDLKAKKDFMLLNGIDPNNIRFIKKTHKRYRITTVCPAFGVLLEDRDGIIQVGRIPFFITGPARFGSQFRGIPDLAADLQRNVNKYIMMMQELLSKSARGGFFLDPEIVGNDAGRMQEVERDWNRPDARIWTKSGASQSGINKFMHEFPSTHIPNDLMSFHGLMWEYADKLTFQTPSAEGRAEAAKESGKLFQSKFEATVIARGAIDKMLELHWQDKTEAYLKQSKITYAGIPREFAQQGGGKIWVNTVYGDGIHRDISKLPRMKIKIVPSQQGMDVRVSNRSLFAELKQVTRDPLMSAILDGNIIDTIPMTDDQKAEAREAMNIIKKEAAMAKMVNMQQMQQMLVPQPQAPGMSGQGGGEPKPPAQISSGPMPEGMAEAGTNLPEGALQKIEQSVTGRS